MLTVKLRATEIYDERTEEFILTPERTIRLEHSLASIAKWESKWKKPYLHQTQYTTEELQDLIRFMVLDDELDEIAFLFLDSPTVQKINDYITDSMTATTFAKDALNKRSRDIITAEIVYYWMIALNIPFECQYWHFNRLLTLINVCNLKNKPTKLSRKDLLAQNRARNEARKAQLGTTG